MMVEQAALNQGPNRESQAEENHERLISVLDREELRETIRSTLAKAGCTLEQLRQEALSGDFSSEANWRTWFCISPFVEEG